MPTSCRTSCDFFPLLRELVRTYQAFDDFSGKHIRSMGLTVSQFDVIATLGNTSGLSCRDIGHKTLMVKGTLTGVLDRLEKKGLIHRAAHPTDKRSTLVQLSAAGETLFHQVFPSHLAYLEPVFKGVGEETLTSLPSQLRLLRLALEGDKTTP
ncbi:MAG: MarR family transcriptional regulator [Ferrovum sp.]|nr:MarR family transcriptional regulator [Ferrovum sp.]NDU87363.1 MarR family transcriptional regulator [Ferrovum sp.]